MSPSALLNDEDKVGRLPSTHILTLAENTKVLLEESEETSKSGNSATISKKKKKSKKKGKQTKAQFDKFVSDVLSKYPIDTYPTEAHSFNGFNFSGSLRPYFVTPKLCTDFLAKSAKPDYADSPTGWPASEYPEVTADTPDPKSNSYIRVHTAEEIEKIREVCAIGRYVLDQTSKALKVGVTTDTLDKIAHELITSRGCYPSPLNYHMFPKSICTSVNEVICHGIPDMRPVQNGDIINLDVCVFKDGYHCDLNEMYLVGDVDEEGKKLVEVSYECLKQVCENIKPGVMYRDVGKIVTDVANKFGSGKYAVVRNFCGHGTGLHLHCSPTIPHYAKNKAIGLMRPGHIFTVEPMINEGGSWADLTWPDKWTITTTNGRRSAQFEHTFLVTETGVEILTARKGADKQKMTWDPVAIQR